MYVHLGNPVARHYLLSFNVGLHRIGLYLFTALPRFFRLLLTEDGDVWT